jgi:hypothetical protein
LHLTLVFGFGLLGRNHYKSLLFLFFCASPLLLVFYASDIYITNYSYMQNSSYYMYFLASSRLLLIL